MRHNAYDRNLTFEGLLACCCYAIKSNDQTIRSQALQPASASEVANMSKPQAHRDTRTANPPLVQGSDATLFSKNKQKIFKNKPKMGNLRKNKPNVRLVGK